MPEQLLPSVSSDVLAQQYQIDEPDLVNYSEWAIENATDENEARNRVNYSNFVRQEYIKHGTYDSAKSAEVVEKDLQQGLINSLSELGLDDEQKLEALAPQQKSLDDKLALIKAHHSSDSEEWNVATRYQAHQSALANSGDDGMSNPLIAEKTQQYLTEAEEIASGDAYNKALRRAVDTGELSMAVVKNEKGEDYIHSGKLLDELSFSDAMKQAVSVGNMSYEQAIQARGLYDQVDGTGLARHKVDRYNQIGHELNELSKSDENFKFQVEKFQEMQGRFDEQTEDLTDDQIAKRNLSIDRMYSVMTSLHPDGEEPSYDDFSAMMTTMAQRNNFHQQELYEADSENVGKNLKRIGHLPPMMTGVAMANRDVFEATIAANKSLTTEEVDMLRTQREELREANFGYHNKFLKQSRVGEEWMDALTKGRANGVNDADIFDEFVADPDNYSEFSTVARGIGASVVEGFTDVLGFVAMSAGADWGKEMLLDNARDKAQRVEFQEMFGDKYGFWQQSGEMIAPVLVDMGATALLATATLPAGGVGGAAYLASKTGARLSVKGLVKNMSKGVLRQQAGELPEEAAKRLLVTDMIKGSSKKVREEGAMAAIRGYNELLATKTLAKNTAVAIPAFNRSAGGTYASVYQKLGEDKSLSEEDRHDKAMGAAIAAGTTTALITVGFSSLGLGGVDDALIKGATKKQIESILSPIVNRGGAEMAEGTLNGIMKEVMKDTIQKYGSGNFVKGMARGAAEEFPEEALDQFVNTFIEDAATDDDTPLIDNLQQALMAGLHGAVMGAGIPAVQNVAGAFTAKQRINEMGSQIQDQFYVDVANKLAESDSPLTAEVVKQRAMQPARKQEAMYTGIQQRVSAYKENKKKEAEQKQLQQEIKDGQEAQLDLGLDDDVRVSADTIIPKGTPKKKAGSLAVKINEANRLEQQEFDFSEQEESAAEKPVVERNTDGSRSKSGRESASDEVDGDEILVADFTEQLSDNGVEEETIQEFEAYVIDQLPDDSDDFKQRQDWQKMWDDFTVDTVEDQAPEVEPTPEAVDADTAPEAEEEPTPRVERANERRLREGIERAADERNKLRAAKNQTIFKLDSKKQLSQVKVNERFTVVTESGEEMHRVIRNEPATYAIDEIHSDLFDMNDIIGERAMLPNEVRLALESEEARILTVKRPDESMYYISGEKNQVVSGASQIAKSEEFLEFEGPNAQDSSIVAYPSAEVTSVTTNESMTELDDPADLRLIEQEANNRLMADPFDRAAAIQKDYIQKRLRSEGEQTVDEVAFDDRQRQQGKKNVARAMKSIKAAAKAQKEEGRVPEQPRRQLTPTEIKSRAELKSRDEKTSKSGAPVLTSYAKKLISERYPDSAKSVDEGKVPAPQAYLEVTQGLQVDELSDEALSELVPIEQIEARRIPAVKQGLAQDQQDLKDQQINTLRNIIFLGYPVSIGSDMFGMLPQSEAKVGGYSSVIQEQTAEEVSSYKKYFRLKVAEKIERLYPKIDLRKVAGEKGATIDPAYDPQIKNIAESKKFPVRSYSYVVNESGEVELSDNRKTSYYVDADGVGIFNNDPIAIGQMIAHGVPIRVPKNVINNFGKDSSILSASQINPSIRYDKVTGEVMRVVKPAADGIGVETIERKSAIGEILPDTQFSDLTYDLNSMFDNEGVRQIRVPSTSMASDTGPVSKEHYIVTNKAKEQHSLKELQRGFDLFTNSAMRGLAIIKSDQQVSREDQQIAAEFDSPEEASADRSARDSNAKRAAWHINKILGLTEAAGVKKLTTNEASEAFAIFVSEYQLALTSHAIRKDMFGAGYIDETENLIKPSRQAQAIQKFKELSGKENDIEQLVTRLGGRMIAAQDSYSVTSKKYLDMSAEQKAERNDSIILAFLNKQIAGNPFLIKGMPTMQTVANRAKDRMLGQRKKQGDAFYESVDVPLDEISPEAGAQLIADESVNPEDIPYNVASNEPEFAGATSTEGLPKGISDESFVDLQKKMLLDIISESNDAVIETIKTDDIARKAFIDMLRRTTHFGQNRADLFYDNMNVEAEWGAMSGAVAHATYAHSKEVLTFIKGLKEGTLSSGLDLRSTIKYVMFPNNVSDSYAEQMQPYLARQGIGIGTDPSFLPQVKTILNKTSEVLRTRYAMTATTEADRPQVVAKNTAEAEALGLVNGDSSSVVGALQNIASDSNNENHQLVAELLLEDKAFIQSVEFHISENSTLVPAQHTKNANGSHTVSINLGGSNGRGLENVLLEEYMHAFLSDVVARPEASLTPSQRSGISRLKGLMQLAQDAYTKSGENNESIAYQFKNMDEFVAGLLLNPEFQTFIKSVETPATQRGLFQRIADAIVSLFQRAAGRKITPQEAVSYADAVKDVIDLAQSEANSGRQNMVVGASSAINDNAKRRAASGLDKYGLDGSEDLSLTPEQAKEIEDSENRGRKREANLTRAQQEAQDPALYAESATDADIDAEEISDFMSNDILPFLRAFLPAEMRLVVDHTLTSSMGQSGNVLYVNPARLADVIFAVSGDGVNNRDSINLSLLSILDEEVGHYASFNQLTQKEIDDMGDTMGVDALAAVAKRYFQRPTDVEAAIERLNSTDKAVALREKRNMVEEHLRMQLQRATRGFTTEEDIAFYQTNPPMRKILFRYLQGYLKTVAFRYRNRKEKPMAPINRLIAEMRQVKAGYRAGSNVQLFDPENPTANMQILNSMLNEPIVAEVEQAMGLATMEQEIDARFGIQGTSAGLGARLDEKMFGERSLDFDHIPQMFEVPFMKAGEYNAPTNWWVRNMMGDADPRLTRLSDVRQGHINQGVATLKKFDIKFKQLLKQSYGDESNYPKDTIAKAIGTNAGVDLDQTVLNELNDERASRLDEVFSDKSLDAAAKKEARQDVYDLMDAKRDALLRARADSLRVEQETALDDIRRDAPELAKYIGIMRTKLIDELSKVMVDKYGINNTPLGIRVDNQLGIYITRTYKMFTEVGYHQKVRDSIQKNEGDYAQIRAEAINYFEQQYIANRTEINLKRGMDSASAEKEARNELTQNSTFGYDALLTFIDSYDNQSVNRGIQSSEGYRILMDNLKKKEFPKELRAVLGENTDVEKGLTNLLHTYGTVMNMVANQTFLTNIASVGRAENVPNAKPEDKFLMTQAEVREAKEADPEKYKDWDVSEDRSSRNDPLAGLYAPPEMWAHLKMMTDKQMHNEMISSAEQTTRTAGVIAAKLTGLSMGVKTLGSFGFYLRNVMSNILYFGPSQGFVNVPKMLTSAAKHLSQTLLNPEEVDAQLLEYTGLLIIGDNMNTKLLHDLIRGRVEVDDIKKQMREEEAKHKSLDKFSSAVKAGTKKLTDMADAVDSFYKIAYFENELKVLRSAKEDAPAGSTYYNMSDQQLKTEAARKVLMTAQFASQRVELAKKVSNNAFGLLFSPFIGFTSDVFRIPVNTVKLAKEEMSSESSIIQKRGKQRAAGLAGVGLGLSVVLPAALTSLLGGLDREEQDALRESLPEYLRSHSILYWKSGGKLQSMDLTYINPFAMLVDPFVRAAEKLSMGEYRKASAALTIDFLAESFLSDQILAGALFDLKQNRNSTTGESIYDPNADDFGDISGKLMSYFYKKAAEPNTFLKIKESWQRKGLDTENFNDSSMGQLLSMAYPAKIHTLDLDRSFRRMLFSEKQSAINAKSQLFEVYQSKPMTDEAVSQIYLDHYERQTRLDSRMYKFLNAYESMGMSRQDMRYRLVKFGYGKRRADNILSGISEAPSLSPKMMASLQERGLIDRAGPLYQASYEVPQWRLLDPR